MQPIYTAAHKPQIFQALEETRRYIECEEARAADLRPADVAETLQRYKAHEKKLIGILDQITA